MWDHVIIGGGAAGLAAAVFLGRATENKSVLLLEKAPRVGKKLLATGNGTCNLSNIYAGKEHYHGSPDLAAAVLEAFSPAQACSFFEEIGVDTRVREDGRVYPYSEQAGAVLDALRLEAVSCGVEMRCDCAVTGISPHGNGWQVTTGRETITARKVLVCTGGVAAPALGGTAESYRLLTALECKKTPLFPSIVQIRTQTDYVRAVKGIRVDAAVTLYGDGVVSATQTGEVLFTDYGLSGPAVMQISRVAADWERHKRGEMFAVLDLLPEMDEDRLRQKLEKRSALSGRLLEDYLTGLLHKRIGQTVLRVAGVLPLTRPVDTLTPAEIDRVLAVIKGWHLPVTGTQGFGGAQVTAGGIAAEQIDPRTMALRALSGVYVAGEIVDVDGDCGGFNLQFAWSSAYVAARAMAAEE